MNPYDPFGPIRSWGRLGGRSAELAALDGVVDGVSARRPRHLLFHGASRRGKSSLLLASADWIGQRGSLPVVVPLTPHSCETVEQLSQALLETLASQLRGQVDAGERPRAPRLRKRPPLTPALFEEAIEQQVAHFGGASRPVVFLLDEGHHLQSEAVADWLAMLVTHVRGCAFVLAAGPWLPDVLKPAGAVGRSLAHMELRRLTADEVWEYLVAPESVDGDQRAEVFRSTANDIHTASRGEPQVVATLASIAWDAAFSEDGARRVLVLSREVLQQALASVLERGDESVASQMRRTARLIDRIDGLRPADRRNAALLSGYESLTIPEVARYWRLAAHETVVSRQRAIATHDGVGEHAVTVEDIDFPTQHDVAASLERLAGEDVASMEHDRFTVCHGDGFAAAYLRAGDMRRSVRSTSARYGELATGTVLNTLFAEVPALSADPVPIAGALGEAGADDDDRLGRAVAAIDDDEVLRLFDERLLRPATSHTLYPDLDAVALFVGLRVAVAVDDEHSAYLERTFRSELHWTAPSSIDPALEIDRWVDGHRQLLRDARLTVERIVVRRLDREASDALAAAFVPSAVPARVRQLFDAGRLKAALAYVTHGVRVLEAAPTRDSATGWVLGDALTSLAFLAALLDDAALCKEGALRAIETTDAPDVQFLSAYNHAHAQALQGEFLAAAVSLKDLPPPPAFTGVHLLLYCPTPEDWRPGDPLWKVASLANSDEVMEVVEAQGLVYRAMAGEFDAERFSDVAGWGGGATGHRLLGWTWLTRFGDTARAMRHFDFACAMGVAHATQELAFARQGATPHPAPAAPPAG